MMIQAKFTFEEAQSRFLRLHEKYGCEDKSSAIRAALGDLHKEIEKEKLVISAGLYAEIYDNDKELRELTNSAISEWPE